MFFNKRLLIRLYSFTLLLFGYSSSNYAALDELYNISVGANIAFFNSSTSINSYTNDGGLDLENSLGFDNQVTAAWLSAIYRVGDLHRIRLTYTPIRRSSSIDITKDIEVDNTIIKAGAQADSVSNSDILDFSYIYSYYKTPHLEAGISAGIYWVLNTTDFIASGNIIEEGATDPSFYSDFSSKQKLQAPMPLLGASITYEFTPAWRANASIRYLDLQLSQVGGKIFSFDAGTEYYFNDNWGVGASISTINLDLNITGLISNSNLIWGNSGVQIYAVFKY